MDAEERERRELALNLAVKLGAAISVPGVVTVDVLDTARKFEAFLAGDGTSETGAQ